MLGLEQQVGRGLLKSSLKKIKILGDAEGMHRR